MSLKGKTFTPEDLPKRSSIRGTPEGKEWAERQTERYRVIAIDHDAPQGKQEIIAEELGARVLATLSPKARRVAGTMMRAPKEVRAEILGAFDSKGELRPPKSFKLA